ncbi:MAG: hypothetical protein WD960_13490 [Gemmatimonadota bacterium]
MNSEAFARLTERVRTDDMEIADEEDMGLQGARAHLVGLAFTRADTMSRIASFALSHLVDEADEARGAGR